MQKFCKGQFESVKINKKEFYEILIIDKEQVYTKKIKNDITYLKKN